MYFKQIDEIVDGTKTQTRRVCKPNEEAFWNEFYVREMVAVYSRYMQKIKTQDTPIEAYRLKWEVGRDYAVSPGRGKPGAWWNPKTSEWAIPHTTKRYKFDGPQELLSGMIFAGWEPLRIVYTEIRREPLQAITEADAIAEGYPTHYLDYRDVGGMMYIAPVDWYRELWESINGPGSWGADPNVWVLTFEIKK